MNSYAIRFEKPNAGCRTTTIFDRTFCGMLRKFRSAYGDAIIMRVEITALRQVNLNYGV